MDLRTEIKAKGPLEAAEEAYLNILLTADRLQAPWNEVFKPLGLSEPKYNVLRILRGAGPAGHACSAIGERMIQRVPDVTRLVDRLEEAGLVGRSRSSEDRRVVRVRITRKGRDMLTRVDRAVRDQGVAPLGHMTRRELIELSRLLSKARDPG